MERHPLRPQKTVRQALPRAFYNRPTVEVSRDLLGKILVHGPAAGIIVETEAYPGGDDLASHSAAGITNRTRVIFGPPGHAYVYLSYGMHTCMNVVAEREGIPGAVLIRALEPLTGIDLMRSRRPAAKSDRQLANGPGKLTEALAITLAHNGADLTKGDLIIRTPPNPVAFEIETSLRIGISKCADRPLRFTVANNKFTSR
jgi:DNA-3-methyladenine glycosylase